jgi:hypothetical protein
VHAPGLLDGCPPAAVELNRDVADAEVTCEGNHGAHPAPEASVEALPQPAIPGALWSGAKALYA